MIDDGSRTDRPIERGRGRRLAGLATAVTVVVAVTVGVVLGWPSLGRWAQAKHSVERARIRLAAVERGDLIWDIAVQGRAVAASNPTLYSTAQGIVTLRVREGELVEEAQVLAEVDSPELQSLLRQERATLAALSSDLGRQRLRVRQTNLGNRQEVELLEVRLQAAKRALRRADQLDDLGLLNEIDHETARDDLAIAGLELQQARSRLSLEAEGLDLELDDLRARVDRQRLVVEDIERQVSELLIRSPCDGQVGNLSVEDRDAVIRGQAVVGVVNLSQLEVEIGIPEAYADDVSPGVAATVELGGRSWVGRLTRVAPEVRSSQVAGRVVFTEAAPPNLRQNQRLSTRLILDHRPDALKLRRGPYLESGGGRELYVLGDDGLARLRRVRIGIASVSEVEVLDGLVEGETVIVSDLSQYQGASTLLIRD